MISLSGKQKKFDILGYWVCLNFKIFMKGAKQKAI